MDVAQSSDFRRDFSVSDCDELIKSSFSKISMFTQTSIIGKSLTSNELLFFGLTFTYFEIEMEI